VTTEANERFVGDLLAGGDVGLAGVLCVRKRGELASEPTQSLIRRHSGIT
jgi:hypothetical protein